MMIQSIFRSLQILGLFTASRSKVGISEISRLLKIHKGTVQGIVTTLAKSGFLDQDEETQRYQLGLKVFELGQIFSTNFEINREALRPIRQLAARTKKLIRVGVWHKGSILITLNAQPPDRLDSIEYGNLLPAYCTSMGKVFLAFLGDVEVDDYLAKTEIVPYTPNTKTNSEDLKKELMEIQERRYAINHEEHLLFRKAIAAPIFGRKGKIVAALGLVIAPDQTIEANEQFQISVRELLTTSIEISQSLGYLNEPLQKT